MASISTDSKKRKIIQFYDQYGTRRPIRIGRRTHEQAREIGQRIDELVGWKISGTQPSKGTLEWVRDLTEQRLYDRLAQFGLVDTRQAATIGEWLEQHIRECEDDMKPGSLRKLRQTEAKLLGHFDARTPLRSITGEHAERWRSALKDDGLSRATIRTHCGNAKTMLRKAVKRRLIDENPFDELESGATASKYARYVTPQEIDRVIEACPNAEWRLLFGLARYAGLRVPSESHILTWADVDWEHARLTVRSPKTEHHEGHEQRVVPITAPLMPLMQSRFDESEPGDELLVTIRGKGAVIRRVRSICAHAGVDPWKRLWQTLRSSCEQHWAIDGFPQYVVSHWMGHSIEVSGKHYTNAVPDELFDKAAGQTGAHHISTHECSRTERIERNRLTPTPREGGLTPDCELQAMEPGGVEPPSRDGRQGASTRLVAGLILTASPPATALTKSSPGKV